MEKGRALLKEDYEKHFLSLVFDVASMIVQKDLKENGLHVTGVLEALLRQVMDHHQIVVEAHPSHVESLEKFLPSVYRQFTHIDHVQIQACDEMDPLELRVRTEKGDVESSPERALERLKKEWNLL